MSRKAISKKTRFEVFKRDSFTCQYCGAAAPDVILHIDHINPVAGGGDNNVMNLVTACVDCNSGKGARRLDDNSALAKQKAQLDELNKRREQLKMMVDWREGLADLGRQQVDILENRFTEVTKYQLSDKARRDVTKWLKSNPLDELLSALDDAFETYYKGGSEDVNADREAAAKAFTMIPRIIAVRKRNADKPWMKDLYYTRAIIRNRMYCNERVAIDLLERARELGAHVEELKDWAKTAKNWTNWRNEMIEWIDELEANQ